MKITEKLERLIWLAYKMATYNCSAQRKGLYEEVKSILVFLSRISDSTVPRCNLMEYICNLEVDFSNLLKFGDISLRPGGEILAVLGDVDRLKSIHCFGDLIKIERERMLEEMWKDFLDGIREGLPIKLQLEVMDGYEKLIGSSQILLRAYPIRRYVIVTDDEDVTNDKLFGILMKKIVTRVVGIITCVYEDTTQSLAIVGLRKKDLSLEIQRCAAEESNHWFFTVHLCLVDSSGKEILVERAE